MQAGSRNCQAEMPAALAITTSSRRLASTKAAIDPNRVVKGRMSSQMLGTAIQREQEHLGRVEILGSERPGEEFKVGDHEHKQEEEEKNGDDQHGKLPRKV